ncbi:MAG: alpha-N-acetylglucosaminidase C-terminal domain-containing protein [Armatimonadetes bacterium]|nr:alpha-N-acetylglucosaminidase C-terminal domain-containing protein [Armatimonadota bacterium]
MPASAPIGAGGGNTQASPDVIVYGHGHEKVYRHAAEELAKYLTQITGRQVKAVSDKEPISTGSRNIALIGDSTHNKITKRLTDRRLLKLTSPRSDGFGLKSVKDGKKTYLIFFGGDGKGMLPGGNGRGTLYAVYDYLENECNVGFFEDGERVPKMAEVPFGGINRTESPYFEIRGRNTYFHAGLMKYRANYWTLPEWKRNIDWRLKRKMNFMYAWPLALYKQDLKKRDVFHSQWKEIFDYARARGLKIGYSLDYGQVPDDFVKENKDHKFIQSEVYGLRGLHPDDPLAALYTKQRLESAIADYGTDHFYLCAPYGELKPDEAPLDVRIRATAEFLRVIKTVDPEAIWMTDTWDCLSNEALWTQENLKAYLDSCPTELLITENGAESIDIHHKYDFFYGKNWLFGILHSLGGDDELHGDPAGLIQRIQEIIKDPKGLRCKGILLTPEIAGANILYFDLAMRLAWNPSNITLDSFLREYTLRRYSKESEANMLESVSKLVEAMYTGSGFFTENDVATVHQNQYYHQCLRLAPLFEGREEEAGKRIEDHKREIPLLKDSIRAALRERQRQQVNILYENYLVEITDAYLAKVCNYHLLRLFLAFKQGNAEVFESSARNALAALDAIEALLSTRPDYSMKTTIDKILAAPAKGIKPTPELMRNACISWNTSERTDYLAAEVYEALVFYHRPRVELYIAELRRKLKQGDRTGLKMDGHTTNYVELDAGFEVIRQLWLKNSLVIDSRYKFAGTPMEAVEMAMTEIKEP